MNSCLKTHYRSLDAKNTIPINIVSHTDITGAIISINLLYMLHFDTFVYLCQNILQNFSVLRKKESHTSLERHENFPFCLNYPVKNLRADHAEPVLYGFESVPSTPVE